MNWQDLVLTIGQIVLTIALLPSVFSKDKPALKSSLIYGTVLIGFTLTYLSLSLYLTAASTGLISILWFVLAIQKYLASKKKA